MKACLLLALTSITFLALAQEKCYNHWSPCSDEQMMEANAELNLSEAEREEFIAFHLPWGLPNTEDSPLEVFVQRDYVIGFDTILRVPLWVGYYLSRQQLEIKMKRVNCFREDPRIVGEDYEVNCRDYRKFDRGHMAPNSDFSASETMMANTYVLTNIAPQRANHNRTTWRWLEEYVREWALERDGLYVITGLAFDEDLNGEMDQRDEVDEWMRERIAIPTHFYKILIHPTPDGDLETISLLTLHDNEKRNKAETYTYLAQDCRTSIAKIEELTGLDFFQEGVPGREEKAIEKMVADMWGDDQEE